METTKNKNYKSHGDGDYLPSDFNEIGENVILEKDIKVFHPENIILRNNIYIGHNTFLKAYHKNKIIIKDNTWIGQNCFFHGAGGILIGQAVGIGPYVKILTSFHREDNIDLPILYHPLEFKMVILDDGCDIGIGTIILPGVKIGKGTIIGAGSVVTKNIPDYVVAYGTPAKVIRKRY